MPTLHVEGRHTARIVAETFSVIWLLAVALDRDVFAWKIAGYPVSQQSYKSYRMPKDWLVVLALDGLTACKLSYRLLLPFCRNQDHPTLLTMFDPLPLSFSGRSKILGRKCERPRHLR